MIFVVCFYKYVGHTSVETVIALFRKNADTYSNINVTIVYAYYDGSNNKLENLIYIICLMFTEKYINRDLIRCQ